MFLENSVLYHRTFSHCTQGKVRELITSAVEGSAAVLPDVVSLAAVEIAVRHRLLDGQLFQPILAILQIFDAQDSPISESQLISLPLLHQCLTTCTLFDNLPSSIIEHLLRIRF